MTPRPIFIVGSGRSGTSVLTWAIGQHPNIIATPETAWLTALASWSPAIYKLGVAPEPGHLRRWKVSSDTLLKHWGIAADSLVRGSFEARLPDRRVESARRGPQNGFALVRSVDDPKTRWVDGTPSHTGFAGVLTKMFPEARFINLVRNPRDVIQSWLAFSARSPDLAEAAAVAGQAYHGQHAGYLTHAAFGDRAMRVIFEDLVADPETVMRSILAFLGEDYTPHCIEPIAGQPINSSGASKDTVLEEMDGIADLPMFAQMQGWYEAARNPGWRIDTADNAGAALARYATFRIPMPT